jgi:pyruvate/2-oxoglutarate dehydrogenase complex dihydrolipoamide dehydrogenase (E3) component
MYFNCYDTILTVNSGEILGAHIIGAEATELIAELGFAITTVATFEEIEATIHAHPGSARQDGVLNVGQAWLTQAIKLWVA